MHFLDQFSVDSNGYSSVMVFAWVLQRFTLPDGGSSRDICSRVAVYNLLVPYQSVPRKV